MQDKQSKETFNYSYSAKEQRKIRDIRAKYTSPEQQEDKMERLRRLDAAVTQKGTLASLILGILSALVLGVGMCCCMLWSAQVWIFVLGIVVGAVGIVGICLAYPLYTHITQKEREKIAPEIIRLTDELMK